MATVTLASLQNMRKELVNSRYYLNIRSGYMAPVTLHCSYGDSGETVTFYLFDGGDELDLTDATANVHGTRRDGANFGPFTCTILENAVSFKLQTAMTAVEGGGIAEISITKGSTTIGTCNFGIMVEDATFPNGVSYDSDPSVYQDILRYIGETVSGVNTTIETFENNINSQFSTYKNTVNTNMSNHEATVANQMTEYKASIDATVNSFIGQTISDSEVINARRTFPGTSKTNLKLRLDQFLEYDSAGTTDGIGTIGTLSDEVRSTIINWLNTHPANLVYAADGTLSFHVVKSSEDING